MPYRHLDRELVGKWTKRLIKDKGSDLQIDFLRHTMTDDFEDFAHYIENDITDGQVANLYRGDEELPTLRGANGRCIVDMTPGHMYLMPATDIECLYSHWSNISVVAAADSGHWGAITLAEIKCGLIKPIWLAVDKFGNEDRILEQLDRGIRGDKPKHTDSMVRRVLRWMMAPGHMRGAAELYSNCSLAKAWWCGHYATICEECLRESGIGEIDRKTILVSLQSIWLGLADYLSGKLTVIGEHSVLGGIALWAAESDVPGATGSKTRDEIAQAAVGLGQMSSWCILGIRSPAEVAATIQNHIMSSATHSESQ